MSSWLHYMQFNATQCKLSAVYRTSGQLKTVQFIPCYFLLLLCLFCAFPTIFNTIPRRYHNIYKIIRLQLLLPLFIKLSVVITSQLATEISGQKSHFLHNTSADRVWLVRSVILYRESRTAPLVRNQSLSKENLALRCQTEQKNFHVMIVTLTLLASIEAL